MTYSPGRSLLSGRHCGLKHCPVEKRVYQHTDKGPQSWGTPAVKLPHGQLLFDGTYNLKLQCFIEPTAIWILPLSAGEIVLGLLLHFFVSQPSGSFQRFKMTVSCCERPCFCISTNHVQGLWGFFAFVIKIQTEWLRHIRIYGIQVFAQILPCKGCGLYFSSAEEEAILVKLYSTYYMLSFFFLILLAPISPFAFSRWNSAKCKFFAIS